MIDVAIEGIGIYQMRGFPEGWKLISEGPSTQGTIWGVEPIHELVVSCPKDSDTRWLQAALVYGDLVKLTTPAHTTSGRIRSLQVEVCGITTDEPYREVTIGFDIDEQTGVASPWHA